MSDDRKLRQAKTAGSESSSSSEDADLEAFCAKVCYEEITFDSWRTGHTLLDLRYPLNIKEHELALSPKRLIKLSRTVTTTLPNGRRSETRERFECEVLLAENLKDGYVFHFPGLGDRCDEAVGDLLIILRISA